MTDMAATMASAGDSLRLLRERTAGAAARTAAAARKAATGRDPDAPPLQPWFEPRRIGASVVLTSPREVTAGRGRERYWKGQWVLCAGSGVAAGVWRVTFRVAACEEVYFGVAFHDAPSARGASYESTDFTWVRCSGTLVYDRSVRALRGLPSVLAGDEVEMKIDMNAGGALRYRVAGRGDAAREYATIVDGLAGHRVWPAWFLNNGAVVTLLGVEQLVEAPTALVLTAPAD